MRIGILGGGVVGAAVARTYLGFADVLVYDVMRERRTHDFDDVTGADLVMICVPENDVESVLKELPLNCNAVIKSTVPIGTTRRLCEQIYLPNLCHSPEFLTERCAFVDALTPARNIIGVPDAGLSGPCDRLLAGLYRRRFPGVAILCMTSDESEAVKLFTNAFFATKIAFFNEMRTLADKLGLSWDAVMAGVLSDGRIAHSHTQVPGHNGYGFSGRCLPKDLAALVSIIEGEGLSAAVTRAAMERNVEDRKRQ